MMSDKYNLGRIERLEQERLSKLSEAREQMAAALLLLDEHSSSPAAAMLDLAIHHLDGELSV